MEDYGPDFKRCMTCKKIMPIHTYCPCLKRVGREIIEKARRVWSPAGGGDRQQPVKALEEEKNTNTQEGLF